MRVGRDFARHQGAGLGWESFPRHTGWSENRAKQYHARWGRRPRPSTLPHPIAIPKTWQRIIDIDFLSDLEKTLISHFFLFYFLFSFLFFVFTFFFLGKSLIPHSKSSLYHPSWLILMVVGFSIPSRRSIYLWL